MKREYESWAEVAEGFVDGESWTHALDPHESKECHGWQKGVHSICKRLDEIGYPLPDYKRFWT